MITYCISELDFSTEIGNTILSCESFAEIC